MTSPETPGQGIAPEMQPAARDETLVQELLRLIRHDRLVQWGLVILALTLALVLFVNVTEFPLEHPLMGLFIYSLLPLFFVVGAIVFILALLRH